MVLNQTLALHRGNTALAISSVLRELPESPAKWELSSETWNLTRQQELCSGDSAVKGSSLGISQSQETAGRL